MQNSAFCATESRAKARLFFYEQQEETGKRTAA